MGCIRSELNFKSSPSGPSNDGYLVIDGSIFYCVTLFMMLLAMATAVLVWPVVLRHPLNMGPKTLAQATGCGGGSNYSILHLNSLMGISSCFSSRLCGLTP